MAWTKKARFVKQSGLFTAAYDEAIGPSIVACALRAVVAAVVAMACLTVACGALGACALCGGCAVIAAAVEATLGWC